MIEDNQDVVEVVTSEATGHGGLLRASTDFIEHHDAHGFGRFEPTRDVEILEVWGCQHVDDVYTSLSDLQGQIDSNSTVTDLDSTRPEKSHLTELIHGPFHARCGRIGSKTTTLRHARHARQSFMLPFAFLYRSDTILL